MQVHYAGTLQARRYTTGRQVYYMYAGTLYAGTLQAGRYTTGRQVHVLIRVAGDGSVLHVGAVAGAGSALDAVLEPVLRASAVQSVQPDDTGPRPEPAPFVGDAAVWVTQRLADNLGGGGRGQS